MAAPADSTQQLLMPVVAAGPPAPLPMPVVAAGPPTEEQGAENMWRGRWSDDVFGCFSDLPSCLLGTVGTLCLWPILCWFKAWPLTQVKILSFRVAALVFGGLSLAYICFYIWMTTHPISSSTHTWHSPDGRFSGYVYQAEYNPVWLWPMRAIVVVWFVLSLIYRTKLRRRYDIKAVDGIGDCCLVFWCWPCTICQEYRHVLRARGFKNDIGPPVPVMTQLATYDGGMAYVPVRPQQQTETQV
ncbi:unnamed protein product [Vitrella brassicaformis CCMP3155]|uniref:Uncharacterized protein n=2 Tax=Vitrella brassicaformis TaxID=1169539 RepID=A0A0G4EUG8_VITBC|nr:unnamed protein product [Vitrella brassicaformis CCMP3155]|eukprot:CEM01938.1 unnamed protein product [Vitrella brassicaformis CCMP3155]